MFPESGIDSSYDFRVCEIKVIISVFSAIDPERFIHESFCSNRSGRYLAVLGCGRHDGRTCYWLMAANRCNEQGLISNLWPYSCMVGINERLNIPPP